MELTIRCDVDSIDTSTLDPGWKATHRVFSPCDMVGEQVEFQHLGWALAYLNEFLQGEEELIGAAVDVYQELKHQGKFERGLMFWMDAE